MGLFRSEQEKQRRHHDKLLHGLTRTTRLLLPSDPGRKLMLDVLRQYHPLARHALGGGFHADGGDLDLDGPAVIAPEMAAEALLPPDITTAYFTHWYPHPVPGKVSRREMDQRLREKATYVMGGLAARLGGLSYPRPTDASEPLHADVYVLGDVDIDQEGLADLVSRHTPGRASVRARLLRGGEMAAAVSRYLPQVNSTDEWPDQGVIGLAGDEVPFGVEYWPVGPSTIAEMAEAIKGSDPLAVVSKALGAGKKSMLVIHADVPAEDADPGLARAVGAAALGLAAETGGVPMDLFGFRIHDPADLIIRRE